MSINLTGIPADDPKARLSREFRYAQGDATGNTPGREIVLVGNKTSSGSETVETLGAVINDTADCYARFGRRSEIAWMWRALRMVAPAARVYAVAVAENGSAAAAAVAFTFATAADGASTIRLEWGGRRLEVGVASGDSANTQAAALNSKINADPDLPFTSGVSGAVVTVTCANKGPRGGQILTALRVYYVTTIATTVSKGSITAGTGADDVTNALAALAAQSIYYHAAACTANSGVTSSDGGVGQYCQYIRDQASPVNGKDQILCIGIDGTQSEGTSVATSSAANLVRGSFYRVHGSDWTPAMVAAHMAGVRWLMRQADPSTSLTGYANSDQHAFLIPDPYSKSNRPSATEITSDLNNGVTPICFTPLGAAYINRAITSYNLVPGTSNKDYRAREDHIPEVLDYAWEYLQARWTGIRQGKVAADPLPGARPLKGYNTPGEMQKLVFSAIDVLTGNRSPTDNSPILDPSPDAIARMRASVYIETRADGFGVSVNWEPARHDNKDDFLILQGGPAY